MPNTSAFNEVLVAPLGDLIRQVSSAVGAAQVELDNAAMKAQQNLATNHPDLARVGYQVTWYNLPEVAVELKLAVHIEESNAPSPSGTSSGAGSTLPRKKSRILATPFNAKYQNAFQYKADGSSLLKFRIVPIPPPTRLTNEASS